LQAGFSLEQLNQVIDHRISQADLSSLDHILPEWQRRKGWDQQ
jgi:hypothetical protein